MKTHHELRQEILEILESGDSETMELRRKLREKNGFVYEHRIKIALTSLCKEDLIRKTRRGFVGGSRIVWHISKTVQDQVRISDTIQDLPDSLLMMMGYTRHQPDAGSAKFHSGVR